MSESGKRMRRLPHRYGQGAHPNELEISSESIEDSYKDNSMDDKNYVPPPTEKIVSTVSKLSFEKNQKRKKSGTMVKLRIRSE